MSAELTYHWEGDYLIPDLETREPPRIGVWGMRRQSYLKKHHRALYDMMWLRGTLNAHLEEIDKSSQEMFDLLMRQYAEREGVTEALKATDQLEWVRRMNSIRQRVEEFIYSELIYD